MCPGCRAPGETEADPPVWVPNVSSPGSLETELTPSPGSYSKTLLSGFPFPLVSGLFLCKHSHESMFLRYPKDPGCWDYGTGISDRKKTIPAHRGFMV